MKNRGFAETDRHRRFRAFVAPGVALILANGVSAGCGDDASTPAADAGAGDAGVDAADVSSDAASDTLLPDAADTIADADPPEETNALILHARAVGLAEYLESAPAPTLESDVDGEKTWVWGLDDGPLCMRGSEFRFATRARSSNDLLVFLQGGGACWDGFCLAVNAAPAGVPDVNALNLGLDANPLKDWNVAYLPYCDGSLFVGDIDHDDDEDGEPDRFHRGLQNLSAALTHTRQEFPAPERVLLTGSSAGGFGTILATLLVRVTWPETEILVFNDSGVGVTRGDDPAFLAHILEQFNATRFLPEDCPDCTASGHITPLIGWALERDPGIRIALFSSWYDTIIGDVFLQWDSALFAAAIEAQTGAIVEAWPEQARRFIVDGTTHTSLLGDASGVIGEDLGAIELPPGFAQRLSGVQIGSLTDTAIGEVTMSEWLAGFVANDERWVNLVEEPSEPSW